MSENNQKMEPPVPHMTVKEQKKLAQLQKTNNMKDNYTYAFQTMKAACPDSVYGNKAAPLFALIDNPNDPKAAYYHDRLEYNDFMSKDYKLQQARQNEFLLQNEARRLGEVALKVEITLEKAKEWLTFQRETRYQSYYNRTDLPTDDEKRKWAKFYRELQTVFESLEWKTFNRPAEDRENKEKRFRVNALHFYNMARILRWKARKPVKTAEFDTFFAAMNSFLDFSEDKKKREKHSWGITQSVDRKRKTMEESPFYLIYVSDTVDGKTAVAMDLQTKNDDSWFRVFPNRAKLLKSKKPIEAMYRICRKNNSDFSEPSTIVFEMLKKYKGSEYETVAVLNQHGLTTVHDVFLPSIKRIIEEYTDDPVDYLQRKGKAMGRCCICWLQLSDARSLAVGMGAICKKKFLTRLEERNKRFAQMSSTAFNNATNGITNNSTAASNSTTTTTSTTSNNTVEEKPISVQKNKIIEKQNDDDDDDDCDLEETESQDGDLEETESCDEQEEKNNNNDDDDGDE